MEQNRIEQTTTPLAEVVGSTPAGCSFTEENDGDRSKNVANSATPTRLDVIRARLAKSSGTAGFCIMSMYAQDDIAHLLAEVDRLTSERDQLASWKESAISVSPPLQEIGRALNLRLGESIHDKILPGILALQAGFDALRDECQALRAQKADEWSDTFGIYGGTPAAALGWVKSLEAAKIHAEAELSDAEESRQNYIAEFHALERENDALRTDLEKQNARLAQAKEDAVTPNPNCGCLACNPNAWWMVICETCGNKRCPHATDHTKECTNSNAPGQVGSVFA